MTNVLPASDKMPSFHSSGGLVPKSHFASLDKATPGDSFPRSLQRSCKRQVRILCRRIVLAEQGASKQGPEAYDSHDRNALDGAASIRPEELNVPLDCYNKGVQTMKTTLLAAVTAIMLTTSHAWVPRPILPGDNFQLAEGNGRRTRVVEGNGPRTRIT